MMLEEFLGRRLKIKVGDITTETVDAIVNAANSTLLGGGGVDGAIHTKGGPQILEECEEIRRTRYPHGLPTGEAVLTSGGRLPASYVIHTVGPIYGIEPDKQADQLGLCYSNCLHLAVRSGLKTVAFPSISTGAYGFPKDEAARISADCVTQFLADERAISEVRFVFHSHGDAHVFLANAGL